MNLSEMLGYADIEQLSKIASVYQCECSSHSKNELIQSILSTVSRNEVFEAQVNGMGLEDLRFLNSLLFETRETFSLEDLIARVQHSRFDKEPVKAAAVQEKKPKRSKKAMQSDKPMTPREIIVKFKHQGWLFNGFSGSSRYLFQVPNDLKSRFRDTLKRKFAAGLVYAEEPPMYRDEQGLLSEDIAHFLRYVRNHDIQLTADGSMYKRFLQQALELLGVREEPPSKGEWRFGYGRHFNMYPNRFSLIYDYCSYSKYISESGAALILTGEGESRLAGVENEEAQIYKYWMKAYKGPIAHLPSIVHWINALADRWVTADSLRNVLVPFIKPFYYDDAAAILDQRILTMMIHIGLMRIGEHPQFGAVVRMTKAGHAIAGELDRASL